MSNGVLVQSVKGAGRGSHVARAALAHAFARETGGNVGMMFGLMIFAIIMLIGAAVDFARWSNAREHTMSAIDAAVLAAGRSLQTGASEASALALAMRYYNNNVRTRIKVESDTVRFVVRNNGTTVAAEGSAYIRTPFMSIGTIPKLPLFIASEAPEATTAHDSASNVYREVSIMLDTSGSMCQPCTKRDDMKAAARDLVNILMQNNGKNPYWAKVALVPFSGDVRPSAELYAKVVDPASPRSKEVSVPNNSRGRTRGHDDDDDGDDKVDFYRTKCVVERTGSKKFANDAPGPGNYVGAEYAPDQLDADDAKDEVGECWIKPQNVMHPLTDNKTEITAAIDALEMGGWTAGHIGTAWSYYFLSPQWNSVLPATGQASAFGTPKLKKFAVLMTDGAYNSEYDNDGVWTSWPGAGSSANGNSSSGQALAICNQMKNDGIEVFTVGFDLDGDRNAINTLKNCASDASKAYNVDTGEQLKQAFRDIAIRLTELHISK